MHEPPITRPSLLVRIRDAGDKEAWRQFVAVYAPLVYRFARRCRLQDADAADVTQEVLKAVARSSRRLDYDPRRGSFRAWLLTVVRSKLCNFVTCSKRRRKEAAEAPVALEDLPAPEEEQALWDLEYERRIFAWAAALVRPTFEESSWQAFWATAVEGKSGKETALALGMSVGAVYIAKSRILARLREHIRHLHGE
jgi:RNA polymerase sigma-70 factor (ECF subfamily)